MNFRSNRVVMFWATLTVSTLSPPAFSQPSGSPQAREESMTTSGTVVSSSASSLTIRTDQGAYQLFVFDRYTVKPRTIPVGSEVRIISVPGSEPDVRHATDIIVPGGTAAGQPDATQPKPAQASEPIPASVRRLERDIERQARRYGAGVRGGVGLDPEVLLVGVHARLGPIFSRNLSFRPNLEFGWGEVTKLFAVNLEGVYRLPFVPRGGRWYPYIGAGPTLGFSHQNFERAAAGESGIDFGDFEFNGGLNVLAGMEFRSGVFFEVKGTVYTSPHLRLLVGYTF